MSSSYSAREIGSEKFAIQAAAESVTSSSVLEFRNPAAPGQKVRRARRSNAVPFDPATVVETTVGTVRLTFTDGNNASFAYTVNGVSQTKQISRQVFAGPGTGCD